MKDYKKELDHYEYNKRFKSAREHSLDFLKDDKEVKKFESGEHDKRTYEVQEGVFKTAKELLTPTKDDIKQSSPEVTGQFEAKPYPSEESGGGLTPDDDGEQTEIVVINDNEILYTSMNDVVVIPKTGVGFGDNINIVNNENGKIVFDGPVTNIPEGEFGSSSLKTIYLPNTIKTIHKNAFMNSSYLTDVVLPNQLETIEKRAFCGTSISYIDLPYNVTEIQLEAFPRDKIKTIVCHNGTAPKLNYFYTEQQETQTVGRDNYNTLGSAKIYAPNPSTFGINSTCHVGHWRSYIKNSVTDEFIRREVLDLYSL